MLRANGFANGAALAVRANDRGLLPVHEQGRHGAGRTQRTRPPQRLLAAGAALIITETALPVLALGHSNSADSTTPGRRSGRRGRTPPVENQHSTHDARSITSGKTCPVPTTATVAGSRFQTLRRVRLGRHLLVSPRLAGPVEVPGVLAVAGDAHTLAALGSRHPTEHIRRLPVTEALHLRPVVVHLRTQRPQPLGV